MHAFRPLTAEEVRELLGQRWRPPGVSLPEDSLTDDEGLAALIRVTGGSFRLLHRLLAQIGCILAINGLGAVTREVVEAAREVLVIGAAQSSAVLDGHARLRGSRAESEGLALR